MGLQWAQEGRWREEAESVRDAWGRWWGSGHEAGGWRLCGGLERGATCQGMPPMPARVVAAAAATAQVMLSSRLQLAHGPAGTGPLQQAVLDCWLVPGATATHPAACCPLLYHHASLPRTFLSRYPSA